MSFCHLAPLGRLWGLTSLPNLHPETPELPNPCNLLSNWPPNDPNTPPLNIFPYILLFPHTRPPACLPAHPPARPPVRPPDRPPARPPRKWILGLGRCGPGPCECKHFDVTIAPRILGNVYTGIWDFSETLCSCVLIRGPYPGHRRSYYVCVFHYTYTFIPRTPSPPPSPLNFPKCVCA